MVGLDYAFLSHRSMTRSAEDDDREDDAEVESTMKVLVGHDNQSKTCVAMPMPEKGIGREAWSACEALRYVDFLGYQRLIIKTDQEETLNAAIRHVRMHRML